jgi:hypothetical protein
MDIASYYLNSPIFLAITQNEDFKSITIEELLLSEHAQYLRDDSDIKDENDFIFVLACLTYWGLNKIPFIVYNYINKKLSMNYNNLLNNYIDIISTDFNDKINKYVKYYNSSTISCYDYSYYDNKFFIGIKEDGYLFGIDSNYQKLEYFYGKPNKFKIPYGKFKEIISNNSISIGIREDKTIVIWGDKKNHSDRYNDEIYTPNDKFNKVVINNGAFIGIKEDGYLVSWDINELKQSPTGRFKEIVCNSYQSYAMGIRENGTLIEWRIISSKNLNSELPGYGIPSYGFPGNGNINNKFIKIACGSQHYVALRENGNVVTWGSNNEEARNDSPEGKFVDISCGYYHSVGIKEDGTIVTWGSNTYNQRYKSPKGKFIQVSCGTFHSAGINRKGNLVIWGDDYRGQMMNQIKDPNLYKNYIRVFCSDDNTVGVKEDGTLTFWTFSNNIERNYPTEKMLTYN